MIEDLIICVMFGSLVVYIALFSQGTLGLANAIFPVTLIVGIVGVSSIAIFVCASSIVDAFDFLPPQVFAHTTFDSPAAV